MRDLSYIIACMLREIPSHHTELKEALKDVQSSLDWTSPEMLNSGFWWNETAKVLQTHIGCPTLDWQRDVVGIFAGRC